MVLYGNLTLDNIQFFQLILKYNWPTRYLQLNTTLNIFNNCCMLILYPTNPFVSTYGLFLDLLNNVKMYSDL